MQPNRTNPGKRLGEDDVVDCFGGETRSVNGCGDSRRSKRFGRNVCGGIVCNNTWFLIRDAMAFWTQSQLESGKTIAEIQAYLRHGQLSVGQAKVILGVSNADDQNYIAQRSIKDGWSVRQVESYVAQYQGNEGNRAGGPRATSPAAVRDANVENMETRLRERLGTKVTLRYRKGKGSLDIRFFSDEELERVLAILGVQAD